mmetsp:Transcript_7499/g.14652  ORF Transcript_7499/g.14652 Transcript_7499/m.14652 type:complete len:179 (-) Transcript_7499:27-563(-)
MTALRSYVLAFKNKAHEKKILHSGTGTSKLPFLLREEGYKSQVGIDFSKTCIDSLQETLRESKVKDGMEFHKMDVKEMEFKESTFDVIIDKGTCDCVMLTQNKDEAAVCYLEECRRVLKPGGQIAIFSLYGPKERSVLVSCEKHKRLHGLSCAHFKMPEALECPGEGASHMYLITKKA